MINIKFFNTNATIDGETVECEDSYLKTVLVDFIATVGLSSSPESGYISNLKEFFGDQVEFIDSTEKEIY